MDKLSSSKDPVDLYRAQGKLDALDSIIQIPGVCKEYIAGLASGTMKQIPVELAKLKEN